MLGLPEDWKHLIERVKSIVEMKNEIIFFSIIQSETYGMLNQCLIFYFIHEKQKICLFVIIFLLNRTPSLFPDVLFVCD